MGQPYCPKQTAAHCDTTHQIHRIFCGDKNSDHVYQNPHIHSTLTFSLARLTCRRISKNPFYQEIKKAAMGCAPPQVQRSVLELQIEQQCWPLTEIKCLMSGNMQLRAAQVVTHKLLRHCAESRSHRSALNYECIVFVTEHSKCCRFVPAGGKKNTIYLLINYKLFLEMKKL